MDNSSIALAILAATAVLSYITIVWLLRRGK